MLSIDEFLYIRFCFSIESFDLNFFQIMHTFMNLYSIHFLNKMFDFALEFVKIIEDFLSLLDVVVEIYLYCNLLFLCVFFIVRLLLFNVFDLSLLLSRLVLSSRIIFSQLASNVVSKSLTCFALYRIISNLLKCLLFV